MRSRRRHAWLVLFLALLGSLLLHLPIYEGLGRLAQYFRELDATAALSGPVEVEFSPPSPDAEVEPAVETGLTDEAEAELPSEELPSEEIVAPKPKERELQTPAEAKPKPEEHAKVVLPAEPQAITPPPESIERQAIQQQSTDPSVAPPDSSRFIAEENSRVEEESVASVRNHVRDDPEVSVSAPSESPAEELGAGEESLVAEMRNREGSEEDEVMREQSEARAQQASTPPVEATPRVAGQAPVEASRASEARESIQVSDGVGSFQVVVPRHASKARRERAGRASRAGQQGAPGLAPREMSWATFERALGERALSEERQAFLQERRSKQRGSNHDRRWRQFRAAIENYVPDVRTGNQTALNAAASPFAEYIAAVHRKLHRSFADRFLPSLPTYSSSPFSDTTLMAKMEIILNRNGSVHRVGVVRTSGFLPYDFGTFNAIMRAEPYPAAPESILSGDGRVYLHWAFYRNERQCGTFNAQPYILPNPPSSAPRRSPSLRDTPAQGGVIPSSAQPTWGDTPTKSDPKPAPEESEVPSRPPAKPSEQPDPPRALPGHRPQMG